LEESKDKTREAFASFIRGFRNDEGQLTYLDAMRSLPTKGGHSLAVNFEDIVSYDKELAGTLDEHPESTLKILSEGGLLMLTEFDMEYAKKVQRLNVRIWNYSKKASIRGLNSSFIGTIVSISGVIVRSSEVMTQLKTGAFRCTSCQTVTPADQVGALFITPRACPVCNRSGPGTFELDPSLSTFEDFQSISLQERPEDLPAGQMPQTLDLGLTDDLVSMARPGDRVVVTGIVTVKQRSSGFGRSRSRVFELSLNANHIKVETEEQLEEELDEESMRSFRADASQPWHYKKLISSVAPSIHGLENVKEAVLLQLAGGNPKTFKDGVKVRGDVNILLVGDPGTAKSQLLKYVQRIAPRGLYTSGRGATAAGLCVAGSTLVYTERGIMSIKDLVEPELAKGIEVVGDGVETAKSPTTVGIAAPSATLDSVERHKAVRYYRLAAEDVVHISTRLGKSISVTPETPVLCSEDGREIVWKQAKDVKTDWYLVHARSLEGCDFVTRLNPLISRIDDGCLVECPSTLLELVRSSLKSRFGTLRGASRALGLDENDLYYWWRTRRMYPTLGELKTVFKAIGKDEEELAEHCSAFLYRSYRGTERIRLPKFPTPQFMEFLGDIYSNGELLRDKRKKEGYTVGYFDGSIRYVRAFCGRVKTLFGISLRPRKDPREKCYRVKFQNKIIAQLLMTYGIPLGRKARLIRLPPAISTLPTGLVAPFIKQVITNDGCVIRNKCIEFDTSSADFCRQMEILLGRFDIVSSTSVKPAREIPFRGKLIHQGPKYQLSIYDRKSLLSYKRSIGFGDPVKSKKLNALIDAKKGTHTNYRTRGDHILLKIKHIRREKASKVYDLTINDSHSFLANGFIVHNTAAAIRDESGAFSLEAGALVLADKGLAAIDEFEKMREEDRVAIHEAMEQQTCSIAKGGIVATLNARTSILAAANPQFGRYDLNRNFAENVNLSPVVLSRFDLYFVLRDVPDETRDALLTEHILAQHRKIERQAEATYDTNYLRRYVAYAKLSSPKLSDEASEAIAKFFLELRKSSVDSAVQITPRQLESLIRQSEARAKLMLRDVVTKEDVEVVIKLFRSSLTQAGLDVETGKTDIDILMTGRPKSSWDKMNVIIKMAQDMEKEFGSANIEEVLRRAEEKGVDKADGRRMIADLLRNGYFYSPDDLSLRKTR